MAKVFIAHSSKDSKFTKELYQDLKIAGHAPWLDTMDIAPGHAIVTRIQEALENCRFALVVLSKAAVASKWVAAEWKEAFWDHLERNQVEVIPLLLEKCEIPHFLRGIRFADFTKSYAVGFAMLCARLHSPMVTPLFMRDSIPMNYVNAIEYTARTHPEDHIRLACLHTVWSYRPDRAKPLLEDAVRDLREEVRNHARALLNEFY